jgi:hypothetical protein
LGSKIADHTLPGRELEHKRQYVLMFSRVPFQAQISGTVWAQTDTGDLLKNTFLRVFKLFIDRVRF